MGIIIMIIVIIIVAVLMGGYVREEGGGGGLYTLAQITHVQVRNDISTINQPTKETQNT